MSVESASKYLEAIATDRAFLKSIMEAKSNNDRAKLVKDKGFDFTMAELQEAGMKADISGGELNAEDLDRIAAACIGMAAVSVVGATAGAAVGSIVSDSVN